MFKPAAQLDPSKPDWASDPARPVHTSELTARCLKSAELRLNGQVYGGTGEALFKGVLGHEWLRRHHTGEPLSCKQLVDWVIAQQSKENMPCSESVKTNAASYAAEVQLVCDQYAARVSPLFVEVIGCELPIRAELVVDDLPVVFESHIDLLARNADGVLCIPDFKFREESANRHVLHRNMQMGMYWWAIRNGEVRTNEEFDVWQRFNEPVDAMVIDMWALKPYSRKTTFVDDNGEPTVFEKGDMRPLHNVMKRCNFQNGGEPTLLSEFATRVRMMRAGYWPTNPDPQGCMACQSRPFCLAFGWENDNGI